MDMDFNRGNLNLAPAVESYSKGIPVIVLSREGAAIHGGETLQAVISLGTNLNVCMIRDVPVEDWNNSDWPELLEAARQVFMKRGEFTLRRPDH